MVRQARLETAHGFMMLLDDLVRRDRRNGRLPSHAAMAARLVTLTAMLGRQPTSLRELAKELGRTHASLSKIAKQFRTNHQICAGWQRPNASKSYHDRAVGVHDCTWVPRSEEGKWERRQIRERRRREGIVSQ
jgi:hypothetical protein